MSELLRVPCDEIVVPCPSSDSGEPFGITYIRKDIHAADMSAKDARIAELEQQLADEARDKSLEAAVLGSGLGSTAALLAGNEGKYERMCCKVSGVYDGDRNGATLLCTDADKIIADRAVALVFGEKSEKEGE